MQKIDNDTYIVGGNSVVSFSGAAKGASAEPHSVAKINASATDSNNWCNWGDDNQYPKRLMEKVAMYTNSAGLLLSPFNAWVLLSGCETLPLRVEKQSAQAHPAGY